MEPTTITPHEFNRAADAFYDHPDDSALNEQGNRREKLRAALAELGITVGSGKYQWVNAEGIIHNESMPSCAGAHCTRIPAEVSS